MSICEKSTCYNVARNGASFCSSCHFHVKDDEDFVKKKYSKFEESCDNSECKNKALVVVSESYTFSLCTTHGKCIGIDPFDGRNEVKENLPQKSIVDDLPQEFEAEEVKEKKSAQGKKPVQSKKPKKDVAAHGKCLFCGTSVEKSWQIFCGNCRSTDRKVKI